MIIKFPSIKTKMEATGVWSLVDTEGIQEVYELPSDNDNNNYDELATLELLNGLNGDEGLSRAATATKLLATLENFNYDTDEPDTISEWLGNEKYTDLSIFGDLQTDLTQQFVQPIYQSQQNNTNQLSTPYNNNNHVKYGYQTSPIPSLDDEYHQSLYGSPQNHSTTNNSGVWMTPEANCIDQQLDVVTQLTPPHSPKMYENNPTLHFESIGKGKHIYNGQMKSKVYPHQLNEVVSTAQSGNIKDDNGTMIIDSIIQEMDPNAIRDVLQHVSDDDDFQHVSEMESDDQNSNFMTTPNSYTLSPEQSCSEYQSEENSDSSSNSSSSDQDSDFSPYSPEEYTPRKNTKLVNGNRKETIKQNRTQRNKQRKNGGTGGVKIEDKKLRKKEQNKNAATRYRLKKKAEIEIILGEEKEMEDINDNLKKNVEDLQREIKFMKKIMRDFFKTQGVLK